MIDDYFAYDGDPDRVTAGAFNNFRRDNPQFEFRRCFDYGYYGQGFILSRIVDTEAGEESEE